MGAIIGPAPAVPIQSGVSVVLVLGLGPSTAGSARLLDVLVGAAVGLLFSQVLFTSNPIKDMGRAASTFLKQLANGLDLILKACQMQQADSAETALGQLSLAHESWPPCALPWAGPCLAPLVSARAAQCRPTGLCHPPL